MNENERVQPTPEQTARVLTVEEVRKLLREGQEGRREVDARLERMERLDPKDAAARAR